jgi:alkylation response protein AidB-like acyl-CoA dehydrogenase
MVDFELSTSQLEIRDVARDFAARVLAPGRDARERAHAIEPEVIAALASRGLLGVNIPRELAGAARGPVAYALAVREIAAGDAAVAVTMAVTNMVAEVLNRFGTTEQKERYVPRLVRGEYFGGAFGLSEPSAGSDAASLTTRAISARDVWSISGQKMWISTGDTAGVIVIWARTGGPGAKGITCFLVEGGAPGLAVGKAEEKMGLRASHTVALALDDVRVPDTARLGELGGGFRIAMAALDGGRIGISAQSLGIATAALDIARAHVGAHPGEVSMEAELADMATELDASWLMTLRAAQLKEAGKAFTVEAAMAKVAASEAANRIVRRAVQVLGPRGLLEASGAPRLVRDCRVTQIYEGTSEVQRLVVGRALLKQN